MVALCVHVMLGKLFACRLHYWCACSLCRETAVYELFFCVLETGVTIYHIMLEECVVAVVTDAVL